MYNSVAKSKMTFKSKIAKVEFLRNCETVLCSIIFLRHDTQHNDTQHNDVQHNNTQHNDTHLQDIQHKNK